MDSKDNRMIVGDNIRGDRSPSDLYITPPFAIEQLLLRENFEGLVWEPACGTGAISRYLLNCMASDISDESFIEGEQGVDFLSEFRKVDHIVTNPPFRLAERFVYHSLECATGKVALLMKLVFLEGRKRYKLFQETPLREVIVFSDRLSFGGYQDFGGMMAFAWFIWEHGYKGRAELSWIRR